LRKQLSISLRLTCWFSAIFLAGFIVFGVVMWGDLALSLYKGREKTLEGRAKRLTELLLSSRHDDRARQAAKFDDFAQGTPEGHFIQVNGLGDIRAFPLSGIAAFPWPDFRGCRDDCWRRARFNGHEYLVLSRALPPTVPYLRILVAGQLQDNRLLLERFTTGLWWAIPALLLVSATSGYFVSLRALNPLARLTAGVRSVGVGNLGRRLPVPNSGDELAGLAEAFNEMLHRLDISVDKITRFTADASHELRSPIAVIRTLAECALRISNLEREVADSFHEIIAETEDASLLLEDMLTLARADAGREITMLEPVDLSRLVPEAVEKLRPLASEKGHNLRVTATRQEAYVSGDSARIRRLLWILIDNAFKYTSPPGKIEVSITVSQSSVIMTVSDNGRGIPPAALPFIFDRLFRVDPARSETPGSGLGLAIARWIADIHQARIEVESEPGVGSTFQVLFPKWALTP
jgi:two-component system, OmpR family, heavy metal sensor histidine kinase CusS